MNQAYAKQLDEQDPLGKYRKEFVIPAVEGREQVYFLGNSLGLQPVRTHQALKSVLDQWGQYGVEGFFMGDRPWMDVHDQLRVHLAPIVGARPAELVVMNQLTVNLHLMLASFYRPKGRRTRILCEARAFPSDQYMFETHLKHLGLDPETTLIEVSPAEGQDQLTTAQLLATIEQYGPELALVCLGGVNYYTGQVFDMAAITAAAHRVGAVAGFDLAHAAGNIKLELHQWEVDFACWCSYKYLNSGPGAVGAVFINEKYHQNAGINRLAGWWGYEKETRFLMEKGFKPAKSAEGWQLSTPSILLYAAHQAALEIFTEAGMEQIHAKREKLSAWLWHLLTDLTKRTEGRFFKLITPSAPELHGCQVSLLMLKNGRAVYDRLMEAGFFVDWREPDVIRLAPVPLYNKYEEVWLFVEQLEQILRTL